MAQLRPESPWRRLFEEVRAQLGHRRDQEGVLGSINWLRKQMEARGANPNVVRNIIYRDKGKLADKRALYEILRELHERYGEGPLYAPELDALLSASGSAEQEVAQLLGREKRRAYTAFVGGVRSGQHPKLLVIGKPGAGKTLLLDYVQQALELPPKAAERVVRLELGGDLSAALTQLAQALGIPRELLEAKLVRLDGASAYAVQADAEAEVARVIVEGLRAGPGSQVLLLHLSRALSEEHALAGVPLRLNTPDVPRVSAAEWLWLTLLAPLSQLPNLSLLVSMAHLSARVQGRLGAFEGPIKLNPPTVAEARRFVKARLPQLTAQQQEAVVQRAGRSFEELRTLTLLAEMRVPLPHEESAESEHVQQLAQLLDGASDARLRAFLAALAVVAVPEYPAFSLALLDAVRDEGSGLSSLEQAFLDAVPGQPGRYRAFSRQFARSLRQRLQERQPGRYRELSARAARAFADEAERAPGSEAAGRYLHHLLEARDWPALERWLARWSMPQSLLRRLWQAAAAELPDGASLERIASQVAGHYVRLGSYRHPDALEAFALLERSSQPSLRLWTTLKRAEGAVLEGRIEEAEAWLAGQGEPEAPQLAAELALIRASLARWYSQPAEAARLVREVARPAAAAVPATAEGRLLHAKVAVWSGLIAKDQGRLEEALQEFSQVAAGDELIDARVAFQRGDVQLELGRYEAALASLDEAVQRAYRSEAPVQEQARYLSRRASLYRLRGDLEQASEDFRAALGILQDERGERAELEFWRAKVLDERALYLLAKGEYDAAIFELAENVAVFGRYQAETGVDASFRVLRSRLRLALAYGLRGLRQPYRYPLGRVLAGAENPFDLAQAERLARAVMAELETRRAQPGYEALWRAALQVASLLEPDPEAGVRLAREALSASRYPHQQALSACYLGAAQLRAREIEAARAAGRQVAQALQAAAEASDLSLVAWQQGLELQADALQLELGRAASRLGDALERTELAPYREALLRRFGEALEASGAEAAGHPALARLLGGARNDLRLADALARAEPGLIARALAPS